MRLKMSGSAVKRLRAQVVESDIKLYRKGWRKLKRAYARTPAEEKQRFQVKDHLHLLRMEDMKKILNDGE